MFKRNTDLIFLLAFVILLFFSGLGSRDFWAPVEPRYAEIARVMFAKGEWIVPKVNGDLYTDKPILFFWLVLIVAKIAGVVNEWTVRIPAAAAGVGLVWTTYLLGRDFYNARIGFVAAAVLATTMRVIWEARWAHVDMVFVCFFTLALYFAARTLVLHKSRSHEIVLSYALLGLATLTKGLIGVVLPGLIWSGYLIVRREWGLLARSRPLTGMAVFLVITAPWFLAVNAATDGKWLADFIYVHHIQRYTAGVGHRQPFYYYLTTLPVDLLPWTPLALAALWSYRPYRRFWQQSTPLFFVLWFLAVFVFFSVSDTKRDLYLLPLFPTVALWVANYIDDLDRGCLPQGTLYGALALVFFHTLWIAALAAPVVAWFVRRDAFWISVPAALIIAGGGLAAAHFVQRRQPWKLFQAVIVMMCLTVLWASFAIIPFVEQFKSRRSFSEEIKQRVAPTLTLYIYADTMNDFNYYIEREVIPIVKSRNELAGLLSGPRAGALLIKERDLNRLNITPGDRLLATGAVGETTWKLISFGSPR